MLALVYHDAELPVPQAAAALGVREAAVVAVHDLGVMFVRDVLEHAMTGEGGPPPAAPVPLRDACAVLMTALPRTVCDADGGHGADGGEQVSRRMYMRQAGTR